MSSDSRIFIFFVLKLPRDCCDHNTRQAFVRVVCKNLCLAGEGKKFGEPRIFE